MKLNVSKVFLILFLSILYSSFSLAQNVGSAMSFDSSSSGVPVCQSASSDTDGDGWGWENLKSCTVEEITSTVHPVCKSSTTDSDGDGWGWENGKSCVVESGIIDEPTLTNDSQFLDADIINIQGEGSSQVIIEFELPISGPAFIEYGFSKNDLSLRGPIESKSNGFHRQRLNNLESNRKYYFVINSNGVKTKVRSFNDIPTIEAANTINSNQQLPTSEPSTPKPSTSKPSSGQNPSSQGASGNTLSFSEIEALGEPSSCYPTEDHYVAEFLFQNPDICFWDVRTVNGKRSVVGLSNPTPPANAIPLPSPSGGDDAPGIAAIINANPGGSFVGKGVYNIKSTIQVKVAADIFDVPSVANTSKIWRITSPDVRIFNSPVDGNNSNNLDYAFRAENGADRFTLVKSGLKNVRVTDGGDFAGVILRSNNDPYIACNDYENLINASGPATPVGRANAVWQVDTNHTSGGYIVNNNSKNLQSNGKNKDSEFYTKQGFATTGQPIRVFANRGIDSGKRLTKYQSDDAIQLSNSAVWNVKEGNPGVGNRGLLAFVSIIGNTDNISVYNNRFTVQPGTLGQLDRLIEMGPSTSSSKVMSEVHIDCNLFTINSNDKNSVNQNPSIFYFPTRGGASHKRFVNSSVSNNFVQGSGAIEHHWDFSTAGFPTSGWPAGNLDLSGNNITIPWTAAEYE